MNWKSLTFQIPLSLFSYVCPKKQRLIIFGAGDSKQFQGNPKYMLLYLMTQNTNLEYYWSSKSKEQYAKLQEMGIPVIYAYSLKGFFKLLRAKYMVIEKSSFDVYYLHSILGRFNFIQTWHGTPFKKIGLDALEHEMDRIQFRVTTIPIINTILEKLKVYSRLKYKKVVSSSDEVSKHMFTAFRNKNIIDTGFPRNDVFAMSEIMINDQNANYGFDSYNKVILYAPTFRDNSPEVKPFTNKLNSLNKYLEEQNYLLIIKKHPWEKALIVPNNLSNVKNVSAEVDDIQELLPHISLLITDFSSVAFDFMLSQKPLIFYAYDLDDYLKNCRGLYFDYQIELPGAFAYTEDELHELIKTIDNWSNTKKYKEKYDTVLKKYNSHLSGSSSQRLLEHLFGSIAPG